MSLGNKLRDSRSGFKQEDLEDHEEDQAHCCPHCGCGHCWCHGSYPRKGFHRSLGEATNLIVWVPRWLCLNPSCRRSFGVLPEDVIPYQRFFWPDFLHIADMAESGVTVYRIAAELDMDVSGSVIRRTLGRIGELRAWLVRISRELDAVIRQGMQGAADAVLDGMNWFCFTRRWFHALYPRRISALGNPHNSALFPGGTAL
jgi:hypothetical protein